MNTPVKQTSSLAVISLVFGILGWTLFPLIGSVVAIVTGHMARKEIRNGGGALEGDGLALAGLILGWATVACTLLAVAFAVVMILFFGGLSWLAASHG
ncbi:MAG: DUF4190 domain-containing protein [Pseudoxanthomonas sp.]